MTVYHVECHAEFQEQVLNVLLRKDFIPRVTFDPDGYMAISDLIPRSVNTEIMMVALTWNQAIGVAREKLQKLVMELGKD